MIKKIKIKNFQSHSDTNIELHDNITTFIGVSDSGKSSIMRAIDSVLYRKPFYIRNGETDGFVDIELSEGVITRYVQNSRTKKCPSCKKEVNSQICDCGEIIEDKTSEDFYQIGQEKYQKFGTKLPEDILKFTGIRPILFVDFEEKMNFSSQHDDFFFIGKSYAGLTRNKILSSLISDADKVDSAIKNISSDILKLNGVISIKSEEYLSIKDKVSIAEPIIFEVRELHNKIHKASAEVENKKRRIVQLKEIAQNLKKNEGILKYETHIKKLSDATGILQKKMVEMNTRSSKVLKLKIHKKELSGLKVFHDYEDFKIDIGVIESISTKISNLTTKKASLNLNQKQNLSLEKQLNEVNENILKEKEKINIYFKDAICPLTNEEYCETCKGKLIQQCLKP